LTAVLGFLEDQLIELALLHPDASTLALPDGTTLITVPNIALPDGWNQTTTRVHFLLPIGYPMSRPDCFWADANLRLSSGMQPSASTVQTLPVSGEQALWFSWHLGLWNPMLDSIITYLRVVRERFEKRN
jgi:hypothetical protein